MLALIVSFFLIGYLLLPRAIFRVVGIFLPLKFQRTRTEEITFAVGVSLIPLIAAASLATKLCGAASSETICDYKEVFSASYSEKIFEEDPAKFWHSIKIVGIGQTEFLAVYYSLVFVESLIFLLLISKWGSWRGSWIGYDLVVGKLLRGVNEWYLLLTVFGLPKVPKRRVVADVLTAEDHLYQGDVANHFTDSEGALSGLFLSNVRRFDRAGYLRAKKKEGKEEGLSIRSESYWKEIPGHDLYIPGTKILSINLRYPVLEATPPLIESVGKATKQLIDSGIDLKIELPDR